MNLESRQPVQLQLRQNLAEKPDWTGLLNTNLQDKQNENGSHSTSGSIPPQNTNIYHQSSQVKRKIHRMHQENVKFLNHT